MPMFGPIFGMLWPVIAMAALTFAIWFVLVAKRLGHMKANPPTGESFASARASAEYFQPVERPAANLANLFEMPVLFFVVAILLIVTEQASDLQILLAWAFVVLRAVHSYFHLAGRVRQRFFSYLLSMAILMAMWIGFTIDIVGQAVAYNDAVATLEGRP